MTPTKLQIDVEYTLTIAILYIYIYICKATVRPTGISKYVRTVNGRENRFVVLDFCFVIFGAMALLVCSASSLPHCSFLSVAHRASPATQCSSI